MRWALLAAVAATTPECNADVRAAEARAKRIVDDIAGLRQSVDAALLAAQDARGHALRRSAQSLLAYKDGLVHHDAQVREFAREDAANTRRQEDAELFEAEARHEDEMKPNAFGAGQPTFDLAAREEEIKANAQQQLKYIAGNLTEELIDLEAQGENALLYAEHKEQLINGEYKKHEHELLAEVHEADEWTYMLNEIRVNVSKLREDCEHTFPTPPPTPVDMNSFRTPAPTPFSAAAHTPKLSEGTEYEHGEHPYGEPSPEWPPEWYGEEDAEEKWKSIHGHLQQITDSVFAHSLGTHEEEEEATTPAPPDPTEAPTPAPHPMDHMRADARAFAQPVEAKDWPTDEEPAQAPEAPETPEPPAA